MCTKNDSKLEQNLKMICSPQPVVVKLIHFLKSFQKLFHHNVKQPIYKICTKCMIRKIRNIFYPENALITRERESRMCICFGILHIFTRRECNVIIFIITSPNRESLIVHVSSYITAISTTFQL